MILLSEWFLKEEDDDEDEYEKEEKITDPIIIRNNKIKRNTIIGGAAAIGLHGGVKTNINNKDINKKSDIITNTIKKMNKRNVSRDKVIKYAHASNNKLEKLRRKNLNNVLIKSAIIGVGSATAGSLYLANKNK